MYIVELLITLKEKFSSKPKEEVLSDEKDYEDLACEHIFVPLDSTKEVLACSKCGFLLHAKDIPKKDKGDNFFTK